MKGSELVDVSVDPREERRVLLRRARHVGISVVGVVLIIISMAGIYAYDYYTDRRDVLALSQDVVETLEDRVRAQLEHNLGTARAAVNIMAGFSESILLQPGRNEIEGVVLHAMRARPRFAQFYFGFPNGDFLMVSRSSNGSLDTRRIEHDSDGRQVTWTRRDAQSAIVGVEEVAVDTFDPRVRSWYVEALSTEGAHWTEVYIFFTSRRPGITVSHAVRSAAGDVIAVVGLDLLLESLSHLVGELRIGESGIAMILDERGRLVAFPDAEKVVRVNGDTLEHRTLDQVGDPVLSELYDRLRISGDRRTVMTIDNERYIVSASSISALVDRPWSLVFLVPETDFTGLLAANTRNELLMLVGIVILLIALVGRLTYREIVADRKASLLERRHRRINAQRVAFEELVSTAATLDLDPDKVLHTLTDSTARGLGAKRISVWALEAQSKSIICRDCFDMESRQHSCGFRILEAECPALFQALRAGQALAIEDVSKDVRTVGLEEAHMGSGECKSLLSVPVRLRNQLIGFVWIEDRPTSVERLSESRTFALALANVIAAQFALSPPQEDLQNTSFVAPTAPVVASASGASARRSVAAVSSSRTPASPIAMRTASLIDERNRRFLREATRRGLEGGQLGATLFPHTTVLVLRIADDLALAAKDGDRENGTVFETIVKVCQMAATEYDIPYMKVVNQEIVAAGGFTTDSEATAITVADFALDAQEALSRVLADVQAPTAYAMGIDTGPALGSPVGLGRLAYNLWGQAVRIASQMAATARPGTIQVTETTGEQLRDRYLLRRRGGFYLEESGEVTIYALGARL